MIFAGLERPSGSNSSQFTQVISVPSQKPVVSLFLARRE